MILLKQEISNNLALRSSAKRLFEIINNQPNNEVEINFDEITSISRSFASEYVSNKNISTKSIHEIHVPLNVEKMFEIVNHKNPRKMIIQMDTIQPTKL